MVFVNLRHTLSQDLDDRLLAYANTSWNAYEAVYGLQQLAALLPLYRRDLEEFYGAQGIGDARRAWGVVADLISAMTGAEPSLDTLADFGYDEHRAVDRIIAHGGSFSLWQSAVLQKLDFREAVLGDLDPLLLDAQIHDTIAKPLFDMFQAELHAYDDEALASMNKDATVRTFRDLVRAMADEPTSFPMWDDRPLFLEEQKALIDYLSKAIGSEIIADSLVDEILGEYVLRQSAVVVELGGVAKLDINVVPDTLLRKPLELVFHQAGNAALEALKTVQLGGGTLERVFAVERAVFNELGIDVGPAFSTTRLLAMDRHVEAYHAQVIDLRDRKDLSRKLVFPFNFPDFNDRA